MCLSTTELCENELKQGLNAYLHLSTVLSTMLNCALFSKQSVSHSRVFKDVLSYFTGGYLNKMDYFFFLQAVLSCFYKENFICTSLSKFGKLSSDTCSV